MLVSEACLISMLLSMCIYTDVGSDVDRWLAMLIDVVIAALRILMLTCISMLISMLICISMIIPFK